jgi:hypothetical protein
MQMWADTGPWRGHLDLRLLNKACCRAVDGGITGGRWTPTHNGAPPTTSHGVTAAARALSKTPNLTQLRLFDIGGAEVEQLLARLAGAGTAQASTIARVQKLSVNPSPLPRGTSTGDDSSLFGVDGTCALLRSLAHLPSLQVGAGGCCA